MYRIRSGSGAEAVYGSLEEFNAAVRRGAVSPDDEIFHMRANRWLDVKSHPHYRLAIGGAGHGDTPPVAAPAAARPTPAPVPPKANPAAASTPPVPAKAPVQTGEHLAVRPQQTVLRPQLVAQPGPVATQAPAQRSKDLSAIDLGGSAPASQRNATVIEARKPPASAPVPAPTPAQPKAEPKSAVPMSEVEFLVMDGGIESPVRTSQGLRTIPQDLDLLFDASKHDVKAPSSPSVAVAPALPKTQVQALPRLSAPKVEKPIAATGPGAAQKTESPKAEAPKVEAPPASATAPAAAGAGAGAGAGAATVAPRKPVIATKPVVAEDLTIPGAALLQAPSAGMPAVVAGHHAEPASAGRSIAMLAGAAVAVLVVVGGLLAWKPWSGRAATSPNETQSMPSTESIPAAQPAANAPVASVPSPPTANEPVAKPSVPVAPKPAGVAAKPDSSATKPADDQVIAAARPNFKANMDVPSGDLGLGSDIRTAAAPTTVVAPTELTHRLEAAEQLAQLELGTKLGGFHVLLAPNRLATSDGVSSARTAWANGADMIRQYRTRIARMEKAYEDSVLTSQRAQRWSGEEMRAWAGHQSQAEPVETSQLADLMFSQVSEGLDILAALDGQYEIKDGLITFKNPASGTRYTSIRTWVEQRMQVWSGTPESARAYSVSAILRALGDGLPATR